MNDQGFPIIEYRRDQSPREWGLMHGESYRSGIHELFEIRLSLMREKNKTLSADDIHRLAGEQWSRTKTVDPHITDELEGICAGSNLSQEQIVVLNNYTDFRDIQMENEGCSIVFINYDSGPVAGQTWDMHASAKNYVCCMRIPILESDAQLVVFSIVGCVGMMGYSSSGTMVGVNNINTDGAVAGAMWPLIVRKTLEHPLQTAMSQYLTNVEVTSGHNYLIASRERAEMWEVMPGLNERVSSLAAEEPGFLFHTNHCVGEKAKLREITTAQNSTTHIRFKLLQKKIGNARDFDDVYTLLNDHENYPQSICSNYQASSQDPAVTCGGAVGNLRTGEVTMWRGDPEYDSNFKRHTFSCLSPELP